MCPSPAKYGFLPVITAQKEWRLLLVWHWLTCLQLCMGSKSPTCSPFLFFLHLPLKFLPLTVGCLQILCTLRFLGKKKNPHNKKQCKGKRNSIRSALNKSPLNSPPQPASKAKVNLHFLSSCLPSHCASSLWFCPFHILPSFCSSPQLLGGHKFLLPIKETLSLLSWKNCSK